MMIKEEKPIIWDEFKEKLFNNDYADAFNYKCNKINDVLSYKASLVYFDEKAPLGVAILDDSENKDGDTIEINIARVADKPGVGKSLLLKSEKTASGLGYKRIIAIVKQQNRERLETVMWFVKNGYLLENIPNESDKSKIEKHCNEIFPHIISVILFKEL